MPISFIMTAFESIADVSIYVKSRIHVFFPYFYFTISHHQWQNDIVEKLRKRISVNSLAYKTECAIIIFSINVKFFHTNSNKKFPLYSSCFFFTVLSASFQLQWISHFIISLFFSLILILIFIFVDSCFLFIYLGKC